MAKGKITENDFLNLMDESDESTRPFTPTKDQNLGQSSDKQVANRQQTGSKEIAETDSKQVASRQKSQEHFNETGSRTDSKKNQNRQQTDSKRIAKQAVFESLVGHEKSLLLLIFMECSRVGSLVSPELTLSHISEVLKCTPGTAKSAISRLIEKGFISRAKSKTGRGGWIKFGLEKELYQDLRIRETDSKEIANRQQLDSKQVAQRVAEQIADSPCSSSILNSDKNLTTTESEFWLSVPENLKGLVSVKQLRSFVEQGLISVDELQNSLDGFAFDMEKGTIKAKNGNSIAILIGAIKSGGYISQQYLSELKAVLAENEKARDEIQKVQAEIAAMDLIKKFDEFRSKNPEAAERLKPVDSIVKNFQPGSIGFQMWLERYRQEVESDTQK